MKDLLTDLQHTKVELIDTIAAFNDQQFNKVPFEDSWTPAQVTDHIQKAIGLDVLYGKTKPTERAPDEKVKQTADLFLNMDIKMKSPDFILPTNAPLSKPEVLDKAEQTFFKLTEAAKALDLNLTCLDFEIPGFGEFTRLEFMWFYLFHTQRHIYQLKNIAKVIAD